MKVCITRAPSWMAWLALVASMAAAVTAAAPMVACGSSSTECTCVVDNGGERRTLACGETACVGGTVIACGDQNKTVTRGSCTPGSSPGSGNGGTDDSGSTAPPDTACSDLSAFCTTQCNAPASLAADCLSTASSADPDSCRAWQGTNGILCKP